MEKTSRRGDDGEFEPEPLPQLPIAPDGGITMGFIGLPAPVPARTPENFVCLRGPCRHYWHLVTMAEAGNPAGTVLDDGRTLDGLRQHHHICLVNPGYETEFADDNAFECNRWDPLTIREIAERDHRRALYAQQAHHEASQLGDEDAADPDLGAPPDEPAG